jgi:hypothetical protein
MYDPPQAVGPRRQNDGNRKPQLAQHVKVVLCMGECPGPRTDAQRERLSVRQIDPEDGVAAFAQGLSNGAQRARPESRGRKVHSFALFDSILQEGLFHAILSTFFSIAECAA